MDSMISPLFHNCCISNGKIHFLENDESKFPLEKLEEEALKNMETLKVDFL